MSVTRRNAAAVVRKQVTFTAEFAERLAKVENASALLEDLGRRHFEMDPVDRGEIRARGRFQQKRGCCGEYETGSGHHGDECEHAAAEEIGSPTP